MTEKKELLFSEQVDAVLKNKYERINTLKVCETPEILQQAGLKKLPMLYTQKHLKDAVHEKSDTHKSYHGLSIDVIKKLPEYIQHPAMIFDSPKNEKSIICLLEAVDSDRLPLIMSIRADGKGVYELQEIETNFITSVYGKENFGRYIENVINHNELIYIDKDKSQNLERISEIQLLCYYSDSNYNTIIKPARCAGKPEIKKEYSSAKETKGTLAKLNLTENKVLKIDKLQDRLSQATRRILNNEEEWKKFLAFSARFISYTFHNQVLIYDQRPAATAVAELDVWNKHLGFGIKPGTHGIPLLDKRDAKYPAIRYVHDVADVYALKKGTPIPVTWKFPKDSLAQMTNRICKDVSAREETPEHRLWGWIGQQVELSVAKELLDLLRRQGNEAKVSGLNVQIAEEEAKSLQKFMHATIAYQVFARCRLDVMACDSLNSKLLSGNPYNLSALAAFDEYAIGYFGNMTSLSAQSIFRIVLAEIKIFEKEQALRSQNTARIAAEQVPVDPKMEGQEPEKEQDGEKETVKGEPAGNYHITNDHLGEGGAKEKFQNNMEAIFTLHAIEEDGRNASADEQDTLSKYVGWGGLSQAFDETRENWRYEYTQLKKELTPNEYQSARGSVLNAHYTAPALIRSIYSTLNQMGFESGNILEPSCGTGNFFGMLPEKENMAKSRLFGVELDDISGRIAKQLYPEANISICGYEKTKFPNNFFDIVVGNVPFGDYKVTDCAYDKYNFMIHDYFIAKGLDQLRPGGVMAVITSAGTMDKLNASARRYFAGRAELVGAVRLPDDAFKANAGTEVTTDILFFQKADGVLNPNPLWLQSLQNIPDNDPIVPGDIVSHEVYNWDREEEKRVKNIHECTVIECKTHLWTGKLYYTATDNMTGEECSLEADALQLVRRGMPVYTCNQYFHEHPEMVLGELKMVSGPYGDRLVCKAIADDVMLEQKILTAVKHIEARILPIYADELGEREDSVESIPADLAVKNYSYTVVDGSLYYRQDSLMIRQALEADQESRVKALIELKEAAFHLLKLELDDQPDEVILEQMQRLNGIYDKFVSLYGRVCAKENGVYSNDASHGFVRALEQLDEKGNFIEKADIFSKRTVTPHIHVESVDSAEEALLVSLSEKGRVELPYMAELLQDGTTPEMVLDQLSGIVFRDPVQATGEKYSGYVASDAYLSGNIRNKLELARKRVQEDSSYQINVEHLERSMPDLLEAQDIDVRLGATWITPQYIEEFMQETFILPKWRFDITYRTENLCISFSAANTEWNINNKRIGNLVPLATTKYGTERKNAFEILENILNLRDTKIYDRVMDQSILNKKETALCNAKAELLKSEFENWIFKNPERRADLVQIYNEKFNSLKPRSFDGSFLKFPGMNPDINLREHQKNAVARILFGENALLGHVVGAGKTYTMVSSAMEAKRIGVAHKSLFVVPNHLTEQWGADFLKLYPAANILVATKQDFAPDKRRQLCAKIATGDYDAVIIGHSQFEKISLSKERQIYFIQRQINEIKSAIVESKENQGQHFTIKQYEKMEKKLKVKLEKLNNDTKKDNTITFEQLGIDRMFVDESHYYKNLYLHTKMSNVAGVQQTEAAKSSDMYMKCQYLDELTGGKGIVFATGTPLSNSMTELYTNMRYLQSNLLHEYGLEQFDAWAANFGNVVTSVELTPEGVGYRAKKRFSSFFNIPELMALWHESADIQTADMLKLPIPQVHVYNVKSQPTKLQRDMVAALSERADAVRNQWVEPNVDNMLKITNDGRKLALDQRLINPAMPDMPTSKVNTCIDITYSIWEKSKADRSAQLIFCDLSTPKGDGSFSVYDDIREKLIKKGIPEQEIAFIHEAKTENQKDWLFKKVRNGEVRFLLGSTFKMGAGTNVQDHLIALHHLDVPWRPSDIEQREGRIVRQGNLNTKVSIYRYVTADTFDAYSWQLIENKQKFISQVMTSKSPVRKCADIDESALSYAEVKALATGNPYIKEKMELDVSVAKLKIERAAYDSEIYRLQDECMLRLPKKITSLQNAIDGMKADIQRYKENKPENPDRFSMRIGNQVYTDRSEAAVALRQSVIVCCSAYNQEFPVGNYLGFNIKADMERAFMGGIEYHLKVVGDIPHKFILSANESANLAAITRILNAMPERLEKLQRDLSEAEQAIEAAQAEVDRPFEKAALYQLQLERLKELDAMLNISENADSELATAMDEKTGFVDELEKETFSAWSAFGEYEAAEHPEYAEEEISVAQILEAGGASEGEVTMGNTKGFQLEFSAIGNGVTVWNRAAPIFERLEEPLDEKYMVSDYETIAYISPDGRNTTFFQDKKELPKNVLHAIEQEAEKQTQQYNPTDITLRSLPVTRDVSALSEDFLTALPQSVEISFKTEGILRYHLAHGINSGGVYSSGVTIHTSALEAYLSSGDSIHDCENLYAIVKQADGNEETLLISSGQLENYTHDELLRRFGHGGILMEPLVKIKWSESAMFEGGEIMPLHVAEIRFAGYDAAQYEMRGLAGEENNWSFSDYAKTLFFLITEDQGHLCKYEGRYDLGDGEAGLLDHIYNVQQNYLVNDTYYAVDVGQRGEEEAQKIKSESLNFIDHTLPKLQAYLRYEIEQIDGKDAFGYGIKDRFKFQRDFCEYGDFVKDEETNKPIFFQQVCEAREYLETKLKMPTFIQRCRHAALSREISRERGAYEREKLECTFTEYPEGVGEIREAAFLLGYFRGREGNLERLSNSGFVLDFADKQYAFKAAEGGCIYEIVSPNGKIVLKQEFVSYDNAQKTLFDIVKEILDKEHRSLDEVRSSISLKITVMQELSRSCSYVKDGEVIDSSLSLKEAVMKMILDRAMNQGRRFQVMADIGIQGSACLVYGDSKSIKMPVSEIAVMMDLGRNKELQKELVKISTEAGITVHDPYNALELPFEVYAAHEAENPWNKAETTYYLGGVQLTFRDKEQLAQLNHHFGCFLSSTDITRIAKGKAPSNKKSKVNREICKAAAQLKANVVDPYEANMAGRLAKNVSKQHKQQLNNEYEIGD